MSGIVTSRLLIGGMAQHRVASELAVTAQTLAVGAAGALAAHWLHIPAAFLTGPALAVSLLGLAGMRMSVQPVLRDAALLVLGIGIGSIVTVETTEAILHWPLIFVILGFGLMLTMAVSQWLLTRVFAFDRRAAVLASAPGHLSYVLGLGASLNVDVVRVTIVQSIRLLSLTLIVPAIAASQGVNVSLSVVSGSQVLAPGVFVLLLALSLGAGLILQRIKAPAALLLGAMACSAVAHATGWVSGGVSPDVATVAFVIMGTLIGTRFSGINWASFAKALGAGAVTTLAAAVIAVLMALPVAAWLDMPFLSILAALAPGGLEVMIALGAVLGADPGLVVACHVMRLLILTVLVPVFLARSGAPRAAS